MKKIIYMLLLVFMMIPVVSAECSMSEIEQVFGSALEKNSKSELNSYEQQNAIQFQNYEDGFLMYADDVMISFQSMVKNLILMFLLAVVGVTIMINGILGRIRTKKELDILRTIDEKQIELLSILHQAKKESLEEEIEDGTDNSK